MFSAARWRSEKNKNKDKAVFRFEFHATQMTKLGWEVAMVSVVPTEVGKPTATSEKVVVLDGNCTWKKPIHETVKFTKDTETGKFKDKLYNFIVSAAGSTKVTIIGEATINLSDYAEVLKPATIALQLKASDSGPILHVTLQRVQDEGRKRKSNEAQEQMNIPGKLNNYNEKESTQVLTTDAHSTEDASFTGSSTITPYCRTMSLLEESSGSATKSNSSGLAFASSNSDDFGQYSPMENGNSNDNTQKDYVSFESPSSKNGLSRNMDGLTNSSEETRLEENLQDSDVSVLSNRSLVRARQLWELELQTLKKQVVRETRRAQDLSRELAMTKKERDALRKGCEELKGSRKSCVESESKRSLSNGETPRSMLEEVKQELDYEKSLNANLRLQLQKTQDSNSELILAVRDLDDLLEQKERELAYMNRPALPIKLATSKDSSELMSGSDHIHLQSYDYERELIETMYDEQYVLEALARGRDDAKVAQQIIDLNNEIEICRREREELEMQIEQTALDYEILKQENRNISKQLEQSQMQEQFRTQHECSAHLTIISDLEDHVRSLETELKEKAEAFEADTQTITQAKIQQEQRAIQAQEALRKSRRSNAKAAELLEEEFERLSMQISSTFHMNEKLAMEAVAEASELRLQKSYLEDLLEKKDEELSSVHDQCQLKVQELLDMVDTKTKETEKLLMELEEKSHELDSQKRNEVARNKDLSEEILILKAEISEQMEEERKLVSEMGQLKESSKEIENELQSINAEREMLGRELDAARFEADKALKELQHLRHLKDEKEMAIKDLNLEVTTLRANNNDLKHSSIEDEREEEKLRKEVLRLKDDLCKKRERIAVTEKKVKDSSTRRISSNGTTKTSSRNKNNINGPAPHGSKEVSTLKEKIKLLEGNIKMKDVTLEDVTNSFTTKEKDLCKRIEELEKNVRQYRDIHEGKIHKEPMIVDKGSDLVNVDEPTAGGKEAIYDQNGISREEILSTFEVSLENDKGGIVPNSQTQSSCEVSVLKEKNIAMEAELKEIKERYSEISLKFAEVEGERQHLVMTVRSLKNSFKN